MELWIAYAKFYLYDAILSTKNMNATLRNSVVSKYDELVYSMSEALADYLVKAVKGEARHARSFLVETYPLADKWGLSGVPIGTSSLVCSECGANWDVANPCECKIICSWCGYLWEDCQGKCTIKCSRCYRPWHKCNGSCRPTCAWCGELWENCQYKHLARHKLIEAKEYVDNHVIPKPKPAGYAKKAGAKLARSVIQDIEVSNEVEMLADMVTLFSTSGWGSAYGGKSWAKIAKCILNYRSGQLEREVGENYRQVFIDQVADLRHNGGKMFDKRPTSVTWYAEGNSAIRLLNIKATSSNVYQLARRIEKEAAYQHIPNCEEIVTMCKSILKFAPPSNLELVTIVFNSPSSKRLTIEFASL